VHEPASDTAFNSYRRRLRLPGHGHLRISPGGVPDLRGDGLYRGDGGDIPVRAGGPAGYPDHPGRRCQFSGDLVHHWCCGLFPAAESSGGGQKEEIDFIRYIAIYRCHLSHTGRRFRRPFFMGVSIVSNHSEI